MLPAEPGPVGLDLKYAVDPLSRILQSSLGPAHRAEQTHDHAIVSLALNATPTGFEQVDDAARASQVEGQHWLEAIQNVARLASVDGAVLLSHEFAVIGFGSIVKEVGELRGKRVEKALDREAADRTPHDVAEKGTRHRSAVAFCAQNPAAVAFVVSQDGGMSAIRAVGDTVVVWEVQGAGPH
jgi:hypothetical protein